MFGFNFPQIILLKLDVKLFATFMEERPPPSFKGAGSVWSKSTFLITDMLYGVAIVMQDFDSSRAAQGDLKVQGWIGKEWWTNISLQRMASTSRTIDRLAISSVWCRYGWFRKWYDGRRCRRSRRCIRKYPSALQPWPEVVLSFKSNTFRTAHIQECGQRI